MSELEKTVDDFDGFVDGTWRDFADRLGLGKPRHIAAYHGYGNRDRVWIEGRLLGNKPQAGPQDDDNWWDNLKATYTRWESDEIPDAPIELEYGGFSTTVTTDDEGYYRAELELQPDAPSRVVARHRLEDGVLTSVHRVSLVDENARFLLISDVDDTVIHTGITDLLLSAQLTFLNNAKTRKPLAGVGALYRSLARGGGEEPVNPVFYLSNSGWNMYDLLRDFLELNELPPGPLLLRDLGIGSDTSDHKITTLRRLLERFAPLPVVLVGDSGQHDAEIYSRLAQEAPGRVKAIYIRDVDPGDDSEYDGNVDRVIARSQALGIPFLRVQDSTQIARHAAILGLLRAREIEQIARHTRIDLERETLAEEVTDIGGGS